MSLFKNAYKKTFNEIITSKDYLNNDIETDHFLQVILWISVSFIIASSLMTLYMLYRRYRMVKHKKKEKVLVEKYQSFLSSFLLLPNDPVFLNISKSKQISERLNPSDLQNPYKRSLLAQEIYNLHEQVDGQQATQLNNYFFGLGLQSDIIKKLQSKKWSEKVNAMKFIRAFNIHEALNDTDSLIAHDNRELSIHAICIRISMDKNISILTKVPHQLNQWEWHKILHEIKTSKLPFQNFEQLKQMNTQDIDSISILETDLYKKAKKPEAHLTLSL